MAALTSYLLLTQQGDSGTAPPPSLVSSVNTGAESAAASKTLNVTVAVGDLVIVMAGSAGASQTLTAPTGGTGLTWTLVTSATGVSSQPNMYAWAATATVAGAQTLSVASSRADYFWSAIAQVWRDHGGVGASTSTTNAGSIATRPIATTAANSAIAMLVDDFAAIDGTTRAYDTATAGAFTESYYARDAAWLTFYGGAYLNAGVAGAKTVGITTPTGMVSGMAVVEIMAASTSTTGTLSSRWVGAVTTSGATVAVKTSGADTIRLKVATDAALTAGVVFGAAGTPDANGITKLTITGLTAGTQYFYGVEVDGVVDTVKTGQFKTFPATTASFNFAFGSCTDALDSAAFSAISARNPDLFLHLGDLAYPDPGANDQAIFRNMYDAALAAPNQGALLASVPTTYAWSDHDFGGQNSVGTAVAKPAAQAAYRQYVPHYPLPDADGIYQTFTYGRVRFIVTDNRSFKSALSATDDATKTVLGATQKQWFKNTITAATEAVIIWVNELPWIHAKTVGEDDWGGYDTERQELASFIAASGKKLAIISGDMHGVAADSGANSAGGIPVFQGAPLNAAASVKGGPYSSGLYPTGGSATIQQYGWMQVTDTGSQVTLGFTGYDAAGTARVTQTTVFSELQVETGTATLTGGGSLAASSTPRALGAATLTGGGSLAASSTPRALGTATLTGGGALVASGVASQTGSQTATLTGGGTVTAGGTASLARTVTLTGGGTLTAGGTSSGVRAASLTGGGTLIAGSLLRALSTATLTGGGVLTVVLIAAAFRGDTLLTGGGTLAAVAFKGAAGAPLVFNGTEWLPTPPLVWDGQIWVQTSIPAY